MIARSVKYNYMTDPLITGMNLLNGLGYNIVLHAELICVKDLSTIGQSSKPFDFGMGVLGWNCSKHKPIYNPFMISIKALIS